MNNALSASVNDIEALCKAGHYDYIIIGSGMGGGTLARCLVEGRDGKETDKSPRVLVIERGSLQFSTHCINTPTPGWYKAEGPSMSTDLVFHAVKSCITTESSNSVPYAGGPVYCLGGRSNVWGMYTPPLDRPSVIRHLGPTIADYLFNHEGYQKAYNLLSNGGNLARPYPTSDSIAISQDTRDRVNNAITKLRGLREAARELFTCREFTVCPMGAEFVPEDPSQRLYQTVMGGYSAVSWMLERCYNSSQALTILPNTQVTTVNREGGKITSITVLDPDRKHNQLRVIPTGGARVILSCGTIDTAAIALRSGLDRIEPETLPKCVGVLTQEGPPRRVTSRPVGVGLTDHDIWGVRFELVARKGIGSGLTRQALRLQTWATLYPEADEKTYKTEGDKAKANDKEPNPNCLVNITVNATSFLSSSLHLENSKIYLGENHEIIPKEEFDRRIQLPINETFSLQVVFEFDSVLQDRNKVLNIPRSNPTIRIPDRVNNRPYLPSMRRFSLETALLFGWLKEYTLSEDTGECTFCNGKFHDIEEELWRIENGLCCRKHSNNSIRARRVVVDRAPFGVVAHEVGTMRIERDPKHPGVVDEDLKFMGLDNLFVCDLSVFPWSPTANPSLTLVALTLRLASHLESRRRGVEEGENKGDKKGDKKEVTISMAET
ncbi:hypothetical protein TWF506_000345 [Arthrobotrys conoides]|uniref:Glucose-methanol-choline oxidoreductase C-terminal domain-containing protein n=1 Tax=Arthrobotrys conoides TaxID=74498 RepID=A0AAN8NVN4_9PEZI